MVTWFPAGTQSRAKRSMAVLLAVSHCAQFVGAGTGTGRAEEFVQVRQSTAPVSTLRTPPTLADDVVVPTEVAADGTSSGRLAGAFDVTRDGAATYSVPIWVPEGRAGMKPALALVYQSRGGDGPLGMGWTLEGLSSISRCQRTVAQDGYNQAVQFTLADAFCLDGRRLMVTNHVPYGDDGAEYRTEEETYVKVTSGYKDQQGPQWFKVFQRDGRVAYYGWDPVATSSRLEGRRKTIRSGDRSSTTATRDQSERVRLSWHLTKLEDRWGNSIVVRYNLNGGESNGLAYEHLPARIEYVHSSVSALPALRSIDFVYESRPDKRVAHIAGLKLEQTKRLKYINVSGPRPTTPGRLRSYALTYDVSAPRSLLKGVAECDGHGVCQRPTEFTWDLGRALFQDRMVNDPDGVAATLESLLTGDANGDGCDDLIYSTKGVPHTLIQRGWYVSFTENCGGQEPGGLSLTLPGAGFSGEYSAQMRPVDIDRNGTMDLLSLQTVGPPFTIGISKLQRFNTTLHLGGRHNEIPFPAGEPVPCDSYRCTPAHKRDEVLLVQLALVNGNLPLKPGFYVGDLDGDSLPDLLRAQSELGPWKYERNLGSKMVLAIGVMVKQIRLADAITLDGVGGVQNIFTVDVDADGTNDILVRDAGGVGIPNGNWFKAASVRSGGAVQIQDIGLVAGEAWSPSRMDTFADLNGDGLPDSISFDRFDGSTPFVAINTGNGFEVPTQSTGSPSVGPVRQEVGTSVISVDNGLRIADLDGDGRQDLFFMTHAGGRAGGAALVGVRYDGEAFQQILIGAQDDNGNVSLRNVGDVAPIGMVLSQLLDINGDGLTDFVQREDGRLHFYTRLGNRPFAITGIRDAFGAVTEVRYAPITRASVYSADACVRTDGLYCVRSGLWVVEEHSERAGGWNTHSYGYRYEAGQTDLRGRGWLGFSARIVTDQQTTAVTREHYGDLRRLGTAFPYGGRLTATSTTVILESGRVVHEERTYTYVATSLGGGRYRVLPLDQVESSYDSPEGAPSGARVLQRRLVQELTYDDFGNLLYRMLTSGDGKKETTRWHYENYTDTWLLGLLFAVTQDSTDAGGTTVTRTTRYENDPTTGARLFEWVEPEGDATVFRKTQYVWTQTGTLKEHHVSDRLGQLRKSVVDYDDAEQMFPVAIWNPERQMQGLAYHPGLGVLAAYQDENGVSTRWQMDGFGRIRKWIPGTGAEVEVHYERAGNVGMRTRVAHASGGYAYTNYDRLGRPTFRETQGFDGTSISSEIFYDAVGRVSEMTFPYTGSTPRGRHIYVYDRLGRATRVVRSRGAVLAEHTYEGLRTRRIDAVGNVTETIFDQLGRPIREATELRTDGGGSRGLETKLKYGPFGLLAEVTAPGGSISSYAYDARGRQTEYHDADTGRHTLKHNAFDDLVSLTDGALAPTNIQRDLLGRVTSMDGRDGVSTYVWDSAPNGVGKLHYAVSADGVRTDYTYDPWGRLERNVWTIGGESFAVDWAFDRLGRVATTTYPVVPGRPRLVIANNYNAAGYLESVSDATGTFRWTARGRTPLGQLSRETFANGVTVEHRYDHRGLLRFTEASRGATPLQRLAYEYLGNDELGSRHDHIAMTTEDFDYDSLQRLTRWTVYQNCTKAVTDYGYDDAGNLTARRVTPGFGPNIVNSYGGGAGPNCLTRSVADGTASEYAYDPTGNQVGGAGRTLSYTSFNLPKQISTAGGVTQVIYDAANARTLKRQNDRGDTIYVGDFYERAFRWSGTQHVFHVTNGERPVGQIIWTEFGSYAPDGVAYLHTDGLGSTETATDGKGAVIQRNKYDPFGARRYNHAIGYSAALPNGDNALVAFTGHKADDDWGLVNMRGRMYDPRLGRFMSADPVVAQPLNGQAYNPYSYVLNNPLNLTDPSGFTPDGSVPQETHNFTKATTIYGYPLAGTPPIPDASSGIRTADVAPGASLDDAMGTAASAGGVRTAPSALWDQTTNETAGGQWSNDLTAPPLVNAPDPPAFRIPSLDGIAHGGIETVLKIGGTISVALGLDDPDGYEHNMLRWKLAGLQFEEADINLGRDLVDTVSSPPAPAPALKPGSLHARLSVHLLRAKAAIGREAHRQIQKAMGWLDEVTLELAPGIVVRKDGLRLTKGGAQVLIIKPDTASGRAMAMRRARLVKAAGYDPVVKYYDPSDVAYLPKSPTYIGPGGW